MSAPVALHLLRHGTPALAGRMLGHGDAAVTGAGIADCLAQAAPLGAVRVIASDLRRAADCARAIDPRAETDARWCELDFGAWDGRAATDIDRDALAAFWADPEGAPPPGGERWSDLRARVGAAAIDAIDAGPVLVVTHGGAIRAALAELCGFSLEQCWRFDLPCAVLVSLSVRPGQPRAAQIAAIRPCAG